jgi:deoxyadenosine/deoxycytidine kinase
MIQYSTKPLVYLEGNIGSGKSTAAKEMAKRLKLRMYQEPVDPDFLDAFYKDMKRYSFAFQVCKLHERWALQMSAAAETMLNEEYCGALLDRSLWGDFVFATKLYHDGLMDEHEYRIYRMAVRNMMLVLFPPTIIMYLNAQPDTCFERIRKRDRPQERGITLEYLQGIHKGYLDLIKQSKSGRFPWSHAVEVLVIPWDPETVTEQQWDRTAQMLKEHF